MDITTEEIRVVAIKGGDERELWIFGYGTVVGHVIPPEDMVFKKGVVPVAKILLDSGKIIYGCECYYERVEVFYRILDGRKIIRVDIDKERDYINGGNNEK